MFIVYLPLIVITIICLFFITYQDVKKREINIIPLILLIIFSLIYIYFFVFKTDILLWRIYFFQLIITFIFISIIYILGKITKFAYIGEGDLYTILAISFTNIFCIILPIGVFLLSLFLTLSVALIFFIYNLLSQSKSLYPLPKHIFLMFLGMPKHINKITEFYTPLEYLSIKNGKLIRKTRFCPNSEPHKEIINLKKISKLKNIKEIWVSPLIPFIFSIFLGYLIMLYLFFTNSIVSLTSFFLPYI